MAVKTSATVSRRQAIQPDSEHVKGQRTLRGKTVEESVFPSISVTAIVQSRSGTWAKKETP